ncbi:MAG: PEP-CTERM sorting domain-containing protein [Planctomycetes bacterium]|nr:PEP-CTERM sorting domain-containing protein [Planctomycetota bacterium]
MTYSKYTGWLLAVVVGLSFQTVSHALDFIWVGDPNGSGTWKTPGNWLQTGGDPNSAPVGGPPGLVDDATIDNGGIVEVILDPPVLDDIDLEGGTLHIHTFDPNTGDGRLTLDIAGNGDFRQQLGTTVIVDGVLEVGDDYRQFGGTLTINSTGFLRVDDDLEMRGGIVNLIGGEMFVGNDIEDWGPLAELNISGAAVLILFDQIDVLTEGIMTVTDTAHVTLGDDMDNFGTITMSGSAFMVVADDWDNEIGGFLDISGNARLRAGDTFDIKEGSIIETRGGGTLDVNRDIDVEDGGIWRNSGIAILGEFDMADEGTYIAHLTQQGSQNNTPMEVEGEAKLEGHLIVHFDGASTDEVGNSWDLISAGKIEGSFDTVTIVGGEGLLADQGVGFKTSFNGTTFKEVLTVSIAQQLQLQVNRDTGAASIKNPDTATNTVGLDGYLLESRSQTALDPNSWSSLAEQGVDADPNGVGATWFEISTKTTRRVGELNAFISHDLVAGASVAVGSPYKYDVNDATEFGTDIEDLQFEFINGDGVQVLGKVVYTGEKQDNNIVLTIDPNTGNAAIQNESPFTVLIDFYTLTSIDNSFTPGSFNSLTDQGVPGNVAGPLGIGTWQEGPAKLDRITEGLTDGFLQLDTFDGYVLAGMFNTDPNTSQDVTFQFFLKGDLELFTGLVEYGSLPTNIFDPALNEADFNGDGFVNAADLAIWETNVGTAGGKGLGDFDNNGFIDGKDFLGWQRNFGLGGPGVPLVASSVAAVPEPTSLVLLIAGALGFAVRRRRR